jgi:hypothetical protein
MKQTNKSNSDAIEFYRKRIADIAYTLLESSGGFVDVTAMSLPRNPTDDKDGRLLLTTITILSEMPPGSELDMLAIEAKLAASELRRWLQKNHAESSIQDRP